MALINDIYIFIEDESLNTEVESTTHPVENGVDITDHVQRKATTLSVKGKIVDYYYQNELQQTMLRVAQALPSNKVGQGFINAGQPKLMKAADTLSKIRKLMNSGALVDYVGRNICNKFQIQSFNTSHPNTVWGGAEFDMELKEVRIAKPERNAATAKAVKTQQVKKTTSKNVYYTTRRGDCIWSLVITGDYKDLKPYYSKPMDKCNWCRKENQSAFSRPNDFKTLQINKKILVGIREN